MASQLKKYIIIGIAIIIIVAIGSLGLLMYLSKLHSLPLPIHHTYIRQLTAWTSPITPQQTALLFIPGKDNVAHAYQEILWHIAQQGYLIVSIDPIHDATLSDEQQIDRWAKAATAVVHATQEIEQLTQRPITKWIAIGHGLGGSTALRLCRTDNRCIAGISMDGDIDYGENPYQGFEKPFLFLLKDPELKNPSPERLMLWQMNADEYRSAMQQFLTNLHKLCHTMTGHCSIITIPQSGHNSFEDISFGLITKACAARNGYDIGPADPYDLFPLINRHIKMFLQQIKEATY